MKGGFFVISAVLVLCIRLEFFGIFDSGILCIRLGFFGVNEEKLPIPGSCKDRRTSPEVNTQRTASRKLVKLENFC